MKTRFRKLLIVIIPAAFVACSFTIVFSFLALKNSPSEKGVNLVIPRGATLLAVTEMLRRENLLEHPPLFRWCLRLTNGTTKVRAGEFAFPPHVTMLGALRILYYGEPILRQVIVPEGFAVRQIASTLANEGLVSERRFVELALSKEVVTKYRLDAPTLEGFLFPDTYFFSKIDGEERIIDRMVQRFFEKWSKAYQEEMRAKGWTLEHLVTMASIVEKETGVAQERELISSVFHNRLARKMKLQSDPTTIYGIMNFNGNLTRSDLERYSPYNTYVIYGLPPGPIANPGMGALLAALRPAKSDFFFFVANRKGGHVFSKDYAQHSRYVNFYQKSTGQP